MNDSDAKDVMASRLPNPVNRAVIPPRTRRLRAETPSPPSATRSGNKSEDTIPEAKCAEENSVALMADPVENSAAMATAVTPMLA